MLLAPVRPRDRRDMVASPWGREAVAGLRRTAKKADGVEHQKVRDPVGWFGRVPSSRWVALYLVLGTVSPRTIQGWQIGPWKANLFHFANEMRWPLFGQVVLFMARNIPIMQSLLSIPGASFSPEILFGPGGHQACGAGIRHGDSVRCPI